MQNVHFVQFQQNSIISDNCSPFPTALSLLLRDAMLQIMTDRDFSCLFIFLAKKSHKNFFFIITGNNNIFVRPWVLDLRFRGVFKDPRGHAFRP